MTPLSFSSLCTGGGLADVGAKLAGCDLAWGIELDPAIAEVATANLGHRVTVSSITDANPAQFERPDILWVSPPCPNFSVAKQHGRETPEDLAIARAVVDFIQILQPRYLFLENVEGYKRSQSFGLIQNSLNEAGYWSNWQVLNAADYCAPQTRRRLILRAVHGGFLPALPLPQRWQGWYEAIADLISGLPESRFAPWQLKLMPAWRGAGVVDWVTHPRVIDDTKNSNGKKLTVRLASEPVFTITSRPASKIRAFVGDRVVAMTPRALARFQTVPDDYQLSDKLQLSSRIVGNGVPCQLVKQLIEGVAA